MNWRDELSPRERQIAELIAQGKNNKEIAHEIGLSYGTLQTYTTRVYSKLGVGGWGDSRVRVALCVLECKT